MASERPLRSHKRISAGTPLRECPEYNVGLALVAPISDRLDALVALAESGGDRTNRKELLASLILAAPTDEESLTEAIRKYRRALAGEAQLRAEATTNDWTLLPRRPGPRPRRKHS
jgi:hypothetical protein